MQNEQKPKLVPLSVASTILTLSVPRVRAMCQEGRFNSAVQPGGKGGNWRIDRNEIIDRTKPNNGK